MAARITDLSLYLMGIDAEPGVDVVLCSHNIYNRTDSGAAFIVRKSSDKSAISVRRRERES
jgi:hypothetical protein